MRCICFAATLMLLFSFCESALAEDIKTTRFTVVGDSLLVDSKTGLMWAIQDNGKDIDWWQAEKYCDNFAAGGYTDWRLPDIKELATLYTKSENSKPNRDGHFVPEPIKLSDCCIWSSYDVLGAAVTFSFKSGRKIPVAFPEKYQLRALPVRGTSKVDLKEYKNF